MFDCQGHALRNEADQERHKFVAGSSPDRRNSTAQKELYTIEDYLNGLTQDIPDLVDSMKRHKQKKTRQVNADYTLNPF